MNSTTFHPASATCSDSAGAAKVLSDAWAAAWNAHDMEAAAGLVTADVEFVNVAGRWLRGRAEFLAYHRSIHAAQMRDSRWISLAVDTRPLRNDLALIHLEWVIEGDCDPDGTPRAPREGIFTWIAAREGDGAWRIAVAHNTNLRTDVHHRLSWSGGAVQPGKEQAHDQPPAT
jgi:uncharacterized protein (TIGR02246 family)